MEYSIENDCLKVTAASHGAELMSVYNKINGKEYLWDGKKEFWGRRSPVLFPFVGAVKDKQYIHNGKAYPMGQHGFARDMEFQFLKQEKEEMWFELKDSKETLEKYPFVFSLKIGYQLEQNRIKIMWRVLNPGEETLYFSIGAHPAFRCPIGEEERDEYYIYLDGIKEKADLSVIDASCGLIGSHSTLSNLEEGETGSYLKIAEDVFAQDAIILEAHQTQQIALCKPNKEPYVTVDFEAPLAGIWTPAGKEAPFVCIEPWYGRCDGKDFEGELAEREWGNALEPNKDFRADYYITIE